MASLNSWLSADVMHALGWTLIHSLWQALSVAALAASLMALSRRPSIRYFVAVGALVLMLVVPVATLFVLMKSAAPVEAPFPASSGLPASTSEFVPAAPAIADAPPVAAPSTALIPNTASTFESFSRGYSSSSVFAGKRIWPSQNILHWLVGAWLCGVALFSLRFAGGFLLLEHRRRRQSTAPSPRILAMCQELQRQLGLDRAIGYLECSWLEAPAVIGWIRPIILLPVAALTGLSEEQLRAVIAHELAHIRRLDSYVNLFQILVETLLFYHPAMWWLNRRIRAERELCCDEIAVSLTGNRLEYARALTRMAEWKSAPVLAMAANRGPLSMRILHILGRKPLGAGQRMIGLTGGVLFLTAALAAANALFGIAYPIPMAHANESLRAALSSGQVAVDHAVRQALQATTTKDVELANRSGATGQETAPRDQTQAVQNGQPETLTPPSPDLSGVLPKESLVTPTVVASNEARATATNDQPAASVQPIAPGPAQANLDSPVPAKASSNEPAVVYHCHNTSVFGRVISPGAIEMQGFSCFASGTLGDNGTDGINPTVEIPFGSCPHASTDPGPPFVTTGNRLGRSAYSCKFDVRMNVQLGDAADAGKMQPGKMVRLAGEFRVARKDHIDYLNVANAKVIWSDPFDQPAAKTSPSAVMTPNDQPAAPTLLPADPIAALARAGTHEPRFIQQCDSSHWTGRVISSQAIHVRGFSCGEFKIWSSWGAIINVQIANPADASMMQPGKWVTVYGRVFVATEHNTIDYLIVKDARVRVEPLSFCDPHEQTQSNCW